MAAGDRGEGPSLSIQSIRHTRRMLQGGHGSKNAGIEVFKLKMGRHGINFRYLAIMLALCLLTGLAAPFGLSGGAAAADQTPAYSAAEMAGKAVDFIKQKYRAGEKADGYAVFVLTLAGEDLSAPEWVYGGKTLKDSVLDSVYATLSDPSSAGTKDVALQLLAASRWAGGDQADQLAAILAGRQKDNGAFDDNVYVDMPAYEALGRAGRISVINAVYARGYILGSQCNTAGDNYGSWGGTWAGVFYPDFMTTAQAVRALTYLPGAGGDEAVQAAVAKGLAYLKGLQQADGGVYSAWDDPAVDNSELIRTLNRLGVDPASAAWKNSAGLTPADYLLNKSMNQDGSFGSVGNVFCAAEVLDALLTVNGQGGPGGGGQPPAEEDRCSVGVAVVGQSGDLLFGPDSVTVSKSGRWGLTALGALHATGLPYEEDGGFVRSIAGQANRGMNGWMYKVNDTVPAVAASSKPVGGGDRVIWWYSKDMNFSGPTWDSLLKPNVSVQPDPQTPAGPKEQIGLLPAALRASDGALAELEKIVRLSPNEMEAMLGTPDEQSGAVAVAVAGSLRPPDLAAIAALKKELDQNAVDLVKKVAAGSGGALTDAGAEVALVIPAGALGRDVEITVKETAAGSGAGTTAPPGFRLVSAVYDFGPDGTSFALPATLIIKVAVPPLVRPENLALARYDKPTGKWMTIPAVVDADRGLILAMVRHFSHYAVFAGEPVKPFADVTADSFGWAKEPVEKLAGAGIVAGVDGTHFEPARAVTRAEFAALLVRALGLQAQPGAAPPFNDVRPGDWHSGAVSAAHAAGLIAGCGDGTFRPDSAVTREEAAVMLARAMKLQVAEQKLPFADGDRVASWARAGVAAVAAQGLIRGFPDGSFRPDAAASRAQCAVTVYRMLAGEN
ncbi:MAG: S-layer homology domain-containing protein [Peptococcaceae bacterium]|nr:S-layer homology domain-containing protein [Peptococcaceae bacterium]